MLIAQEQFFLCQFVLLLQFLCWAIKHALIIYTIRSKVFRYPLETVIRLSLWRTSQSWTWIPGGSTFAFMTAKTLPGRLSTRCLNISGRLVAHSACRAIGRAVSVIWGIGVWSEVGVLIHPTGVLRDSGQDSGLANPFLECYCPQIIPSQTLIYGREHCDADTDNHHHQTGLLP
jgi:hypothetical protein